MKILSYLSDGTLNIWSGNKRYTYYGLSPFQYRYLEGLIKRRYFGKAWKFLRIFKLKK